MQWHVEQKTTHLKASTYKRKAVYLDAPDLAEKYKNKPDQLANVKSNAPSFEDPVRGVKLYKDSVHFTEDEEGAGVQTCTKRSVQGAEKGVKTKKPKPEPKAEPKAAPSDEKPLTATQRARLERLKGFLQKEVEALTDLLGSSCKEEKLIQWVPKPAMAKAEMLIPKANCAVAEIVLALGEEWAGKCAEVVGNATEARKEVQQATRSLQVFLAEAKEAAD